MANSSDCVQKATEAWLSCMVFMVQGNLASITLKHCLTALQTSIGVLIAYAACVTILPEKYQNQWTRSVIAGVATAFVDLRVHPTHFGPFWAEAVFTGLGVSAMAIIVNFIKYIREKSI